MLKEVYPDFDSNIFRYYDTIYNEDVSILKDIRKVMEKDRIDATSNEIHSNEYAGKVRRQLGDQWDARVLKLFPKCPFEERNKLLNSIIGIELCKYLISSPFTFQPFKVNTGNTGYTIYVRIDE